MKLLFGTEKLIIDNGHVGSVVLPFKSLGDKYQLSKAGNGLRRSKFVHKNRRIQAISFIEFQGLKANKVDIPHYSPSFLGIIAQAGQP